MTEDEDHHDAGEEGGHGGVSPVMAGDAVVQGRVSVVIKDG